VAFENACAALEPTATTIPFMRSRSTDLPPLTPGARHGRKHLEHFDRQHSLGSNRIFVEPRDARRQLNPRVASAVVDRNVRRRKAGERRKHAAGSLLTRQAMANADAQRFAIDSNAQLSAGAGSGSR
jgi:hypothetical protein